jgi:hypothetical protein
MCSKRTEGAVLIGRKDGEFWFVDSVFKHDDDFAGCTGTCVYPVSEKQADYLLESDQVEERYCDYWNEQAKDHLQEDCDNCSGHPDEDGCEYCGYSSLRDLCADIVQYDGIEAMIDYAGDEYTDAMNEHGDLDDKAEYADCVGCGRIFGRQGPDDFDEVYNRKALVAILAYEDGAVDYDYACRVIYGD